MTERELATIARLAALEQTVAWLVEMLLKAGNMTSKDMLPLVNKMVASARNESPISRPLTREGLTNSRPGGDSNPPAVGLYLQRIASAFAIKGGLKRGSNSRRRPETSTFMRHVSCASSWRRPVSRMIRWIPFLPSPQRTSRNLQPRGYLSLGKADRLPTTDWWSRNSSDVPLHGWVAPETGGAPWREVVAALCRYAW